MNLVLLFVFETKAHFTAVADMIAFVILVKRVSTRNHFIRRDYLW